MIAFSIVEAAKKEVIRPQQSWLATQLLSIHISKKGTFNKYYHLIFRPVLRGCHDMAVSSDHSSYLFHWQQDYESAILGNFFLCFFDYVALTWLRLIW